MLVRPRTEALRAADHVAPLREGVSGERSPVAARAPGESVDPQGRVTGVIARREHKVQVKTSRDRFVRPAPGDPGG